MGWICGCHSWDLVTLSSTRAAAGASPMSCASCGLASGRAGSSTSHRSWDAKQVTIHGNARRLIGIHIIRCKHALSSKSPLDVDKKHQGEQWSPDVGEKLGHHSWDFGSQRFDWRAGILPTDAHRGNAPRQWPGLLLGVLEPRASPVPAPRRAPEDVARPGALLRGHRLWGAILVTIHGMLPQQRGRNGPRRGRTEVLAVTSCSGQAELSNVIGRRQPPAWVWIRARCAAAGRR